MFYTVIFIMFLTQFFIVLVAVPFNMYIKLICIIEILYIFGIILVWFFLRIIFRTFYSFMFGCSLSLSKLLLLRVFINNSQVSYLCFTSFNDYNSSSCSAFFHFHINIDKDADCLQRNNTSFQMIYG